MKQKYLLVILAAAACVCSCNHPSSSPLSKKVSDYALVSIQAPDFSGISDNGKEVLNLVQAGIPMDIRFDFKK